MSLRNRLNKSYNRAEEKDQYYWLDLIFPEDDYHDHGYCCEICDNPWFSHYDYYGSGWINNMNEYHQMKVLTLLRSLNIKTAHTEAQDRGW